MSAKIRLAGSGIITSIGSNVSSTWNSALKGETGLKEYSGGGCFVAFVESENEVDKLYSMASESLSECIEDAGWGNNLGTDTALIFSAGSPNNTFICQEADRLNTKNKTRPDAVYRSMFSYVSAKLSNQFQIKGPVIMTAAACAGSSHALYIANALLSSGSIKRCLVGGGEVLDRYTIEAFKSMRRVLSTNVESGIQCIQPFGEQRTGIALGEGCGWLALEQTGSESELPPGSICISESTNLNVPDAVYGDITNPDDWKRLFAQTPESAMDLVVAHATSTLTGDLAEGKAIQAHFETAQIRSTKYLFGHTLTASAIIDLVMMKQAMHSNTIFGLGHNYPLDRELQGLKVRADAMSTRIDHATKLTAAFGGAMGKVVLSKQI